MISKQKSLVVLSNNIKNARFAAELTQAEAATAARVQTAVYSRIERGEVDPRMSSLHKISAALDSSILDIVDGTDGRPPRGDRSCIVVDERTGHRVTSQDALPAIGDLLMPKLGGTCWRVVRREFINSHWYVIVQVIARTEFAATRLL